MRFLLLRIILLTPCLALAILGSWPDRVAASPVYLSAVELEGATIQPRFTFSVLSDIHITPWDGESQSRFRQALRDHAGLYPKSSLMVLNGDLTNGDPDDYKTLFKLLKETPHAPVHATMGNHEYYRLWRAPNGGMDTSYIHPEWSSAEAIRLFTSSFGYDKPYHDLWLHGFHFIFLSGEAYRDIDPDIGDDAYLSDSQLRWLEEKLSQSSPTTVNKKLPRPSARQPVFVFLHQPLQHTLDGTEYARGVVPEKALRKLLDRHPEVIYFSGHTHWDLEETKQIRRLSYLAVGSSSVRQVYNHQDQPETSGKSQSLAIEVYDRKIVIRGRNHAIKQWIEPAYEVTWQTEA
jgi:3',5'-cyclic-AMP phosphodiesterase